MQTGNYEQKGDILHISFNISRDCSTSPRPTKSHIGEFQGIAVLLDPVGEGVKKKQFKNKFLLFALVQYS